MLRCVEAKRNTRRFLALTGITSKEFNRLLPAFEQVYARAYPTHQTQTSKPRQRKTGGGRKSSLNSIEQKLLIALVCQ